MFIVELTYKKAMSEVEKYLEAHRSFLDTYYNQNIFIASGPKNPRDGGVILAREMDKSELEKILSLDPFWTEEIAHYKITEFTVTKKSDKFQY